MLKGDKDVEIKISLPSWLLRRAARSGHTRAVLEDEIGCEVIARGIRNAKS